MFALLQCATEIGVEHLRAAIAVGAYARSSNSLRLPSGVGRLDGQENPVGLTRAGRQADDAHGDLPGRLSGNNRRAKSCEGRSTFSPGSAWPLRRARRQVEPRASPSARSDPATNDAIPT